MVSIPPKQITAKTCSCGYTARLLWSFYASGDSCDGKDTRIARVWFLAKNLPHNRASNWVSNGTVILLITHAITEINDNKLEEATVLFESLVCLGGTGHPWPESEGALPLMNVVDSEIRTSHPPT